MLGEFFGAAVVVGGVKVERGGEDTPIGSGEGAAPAPDDAATVETEAALISEVLSKANEANEGRKAGRHDRLDLDLDLFGKPSTRNLRGRLCTVNRSDQGRKVGSYVLTLPKCCGVVWRKRQSVDNPPSFAVRCPSW